MMVRNKPNAFQLFYFALPCYASFCFTNDLSANDLALTAMSRNTEINLLERLGVSTLPEPVPSVKHRLE